MPSINIKSYLDPIMLSYLDLMFQDPKCHDTGPFPARPHAALPFRISFLVPHKGSGYSATSANHTEPMEVENPLRVKGPPLNHAFKSMWELATTTPSTKNFKKGFKWNNSFFFTFTFLFLSKKDLRPTILFTSASCILLTLLMFHAAMSRLWGREWSMGEVEP